MKGLVRFPPIDTIFLSERLSSQVQTVLVNMDKRNGLNLFQKLKQSFGTT